MWEKLLQLFGNNLEHSSTPLDTEPMSQSRLESSSIESQGVDKGTMIGYNYLKKRGRDDAMPRRYIKLSKFLRGGYKDEI